MRLWSGEERHDVVVRPDADGVNVLVDGESLSLSVEEVSPGRWLARQGSRVEPFACVREGDAVHLFWGGVVYVLREEKEGERRVQRHQGGALEAPMPGKVIKVSVEPGQAVKKGDEVLVIEAMKMENALRAPADGVVKSISAKVGDMVAPGVVLVDIE
jgi:3-methylcrotonyl-CoA carboxylase alpha subunit